MFYTILMIAIIFVLTDFVYLYFMTPYFTNQIQLVQGSGSHLSANPYYAVACYFFLVFGIYYFIIKDNRSIMDAFLLGIVIYAVYETTSASLLKKWKLQTVLMDTLWGGILFALVTFFAYKLKLNK